MRLRMQCDDVGDRLAVMHMQFLEHCPRTALLSLEFTQQSLANCGVIQVDRSADVITLKWPRDSI